MRRDRGGTLGGALAIAWAGVLLGTAGLGGGAWAQEFTTGFRLEECTFSADGRNPHFSLHVGDQLVLEGTEDGELRLSISSRVSSGPRRRPWRSRCSTAGFGRRRPSSSIPGPATPRSWSGSCAPSLDGAPSAAAAAGHPDEVLAGPPERA